MTAHSRVFDQYLCGVLNSISVLLLTTFYRSKTYEIETMGTHTLESHLINVNKLCVEFVVKGQKNTVSDVKLLKTIILPKQILYYYGTDTESDNPLTHSTKICEQCCSHFHNYSKEQTVPQHLLTTFSDRVTSSRFLWQIFHENVDEDSCSVCSHCKEQNKGQKRLKREERREMYKMM